MAPYIKNGMMVDAKKYFFNYPMFLTIELVVLSENPAINKLIITTLGRKSKCSN
jgi:hypothetical protein